MSKKLTALYGLKWNPFVPDVPAQALHITPKIQSFAWRVEHMSREGGFASVQGEPGLGKSVTLRITEAHLGTVRDLSIGSLSRPQAGLADFYRELGDLFHVKCNPHNRWAGTVALRHSWQTQIEHQGLRPVLLIDEAQEARPDVLNELRLLCSAKLDAQSLLTVVLCGDGRLQDKLRHPDLAPLGSRIRVRLLLEPASREELLSCLRFVLDQAGNPTLMTPEVMATVCEHAAGNYRVLMNHCLELLLFAAQREAPNIDEKLFFEVFTPEKRPPTKATGAKR